VSEANGFRRQKGNRENYRSAEYSSAFLPKLGLVTILLVLNPDPWSHPWAGRWVDHATPCGEPNQIRADSGSVVSLGRSLLAFTRAGRSVCRRRAYVDV